MAELYHGTSLLDALGRDKLHFQDLQAALAEMKVSFEREEIPFAVVGALALRVHGYVRFTEDIDIVTTREGLDLIHQRLVGRGLIPRAAGLRKKLRDTVHKVNIDVITAGEHAGASDSPLVYPHPEDAAFSLVDQGLRYATLETMVAVKLTSGTWGKRGQDLVDVERLIKANRLDESFTERLIEPLKELFRARLRASREERELPE